METHSTGTVVGLLSHYTTTRPSGRSDWCCLAWVTFDKRDKAFYANVHLGGSIPLVWIPGIAVGVYFSPGPGAGYTCYSRKPTEKMSSFGQGHGRRRDGQGSVLVC